MSAQILDISPDEYHARPGFSSSVAKVLIERSAMHALAASGKRATKAMDRGTIIHRLVLGKGKGFVVIEHGDWRTKAAQAARDEARASGLVPVLAHEFEGYALAAETIRIHLADRGIMLDGASEAAITWTEPSKHGPVTCRGMLDHLWLDDGRILDLKITENAAPSAVERTAESLGYAIQCAAYTRAVTALRPDLTGRIRFLFAFCEADAPYAINLCEPDGVFRELGEQRWDRAVRTWAECIATGDYPGYGDQINQLTSPPWALAREGFTESER